MISKAGSDKDTILAVIGENGKEVYISDGKRYKIAAPKKKNIKQKPRFRGFYLLPICFLNLS